MTTETGYRANPGFGAGNVPIIYFDDVNLPASEVAGGSEIAITNVKFGIRRVTGAKLIKVTFYYTLYDDTAVVNYSNFIKIPPVEIGSVTLPGNSGASVTTIVSLGDSSNALFTIPVDTGRIFQGYQTFFLGVSFSTQDANVGWRICKPSVNDSANADVLWVYEKNGVPPRNAGNFGDPESPATFWLRVYGKASPVLPVSLINFDGQLKNNSVELNWKTSNEINNKGFDVERSIDGKNFSAIGFVPGKGSSAVENVYTYNDFTKQSGTVYYRLNQKDNDGKSKLSNVIKLTIDNDFTWQVYPNPLADNSAIQIQLAQQSKVSVQVVSMDGKLLRSIDKGTLNQGTYTIPLNMISAAKGSYLVKLVVDGKTYTKTIIK